MPDSRPQADGVYDDSSDDDGSDTADEGEAVVAAKPPAPESQLHKGFAMAHPPAEAGLSARDPDKQGPIQAVPLLQPAGVPTGGASPPDDTPDNDTPAGPRTCVIMFDEPAGAETTAAIKAFIEQLKLGGVDGAAARVVEFSASNAGFRVDPLVLPGVSQSKYDVRISTHRSLTRNPDL